MLAYLGRSRSSTFSNTPARASAVLLAECLPEQSGGGVVGPAQEFVDPVTVQHDHWQALRETRVSYSASATLGGRR